MFQNINQSMHFDSTTTIVMHEVIMIILLTLRDTIDLWSRKMSLFREDICLLSFCIDVGHHRAQTRTGRQH